MLYHMPLSLIGAGECPEEKGIRTEGSQVQKKVFILQATKVSEQGVCMVTTVGRRARSKGQTQGSQRGINEAARGRGELELKM